MKKSKKICLIVFTIILIGLIIFIISEVVQKNSDKKLNGKLTIGNSVIDPNSEYYAGKKVYEKDGDIIVEDENGTKTVETTKTKEETGLKEITNMDKQKYVISNVKVSGEENTTKVTGKVKNNDTSAHNLVIKAKFYSTDNKIKGSTNTKVYVEKGEEKAFSMTTMNDLSSYTYQIEVEYAD